MSRQEILNIPVDVLDAKEAIGKAQQMLEGASLHHIITLNPEIMLHAIQDASYANILKRGSLCIPDGIGLVWVGRMLGIPFKERVAGSDFMVALAGVAERMGKSIFLLGGRNGVSEKAVNKLKQRYPNLIVRGWSEDTHVVPFADIIFVALGAPKQEQWIEAHRNELSGVKIVMGVGGAFDMLAGTLPRAPRIVQNIGLEWLWRLGMEPLSRAHRIWNAVVVFPLKALSVSLKKS